MFPVILGTIFALSVLSTDTQTLASAALQPKEQIVAEKSYSLSDRYADSFVNGVFADNILLTLAYMRGAVQQGQPVNWSIVKQDFVYTMVLQPGQTFAFHDQVLPEYQGKVDFTTKAHFDSSEGFRSDGWLVADGVCHLASFMNMTAQAAGLKVVAPTNHDFARIPDVPREYGTAIYYMPGESQTSALQNLYITNTFDTPVSIVITHIGDTVDISVEK